MVRYQSLLETGEFPPPPEKLDVTACKRKILSNYDRCLIQLTEVRADFKAVVGCFEKLCDDVFCHETEPDIKRAIYDGAAVRFRRAINNGRNRVLFKGLLDFESLCPDQLATMKRLKSDTNNRIAHANDVEVEILDLMNHDNSENEIIIRRVSKIMDSKTFMQDVIDLSNKIIYGIVDPVILSVEQRVVKAASVR